MATPSRCGSSGRDEGRLIELARTTGRPSATMLGEALSGDQMALSALSSRARTRSTSALNDRRSDPLNQSDVFTPSVDEPCIAGREHRLSQSQCESIARSWFRTGSHESAERRECCRLAAEYGFQVSVYPELKCGEPHDVEKKPDDEQIQEQP